jgi:histidinol phosphatase-like PHP family hydrolase
VTPSNVDISELLARAGEDAEGHRARAYRSAARAALMWAEEAWELAVEGRSLTELERIGPSLARRVRAWIEEGREPVERPRVRYDFTSFAAARALVATQPERGAIRGDLQMHTTFSDGVDELESMVSHGVDRGYAYVAITDHSKGLRIAKGMDEAGLARQAEVIARLNATLANGGTEFRVLRGIEMNIDSEGAGDMEPDALEGLDFVIGSFHSALRAAEDQTPRYLAALRNPHVDVIGHPRGRKYNLRPGLVADWDRVLDEAARMGKAVETNAYPDRQDLNREILAGAAERDVWISIGTDAHDVSEMRFVDVGIAAAMEGGVRPERVLNYLTADELTAWRRSR